MSVQKKSPSFSGAKNAIISIFLPDGEVLNLYECSEKSQKHSYFLNFLHFWAHCLWAHRKRTIAMLHLSTPINWLQTGLQTGFITNRFPTGLKPVSKLVPGYNQLANRLCTGLRTDYPSRDWNRFQTGMQTGVRPVPKPGLTLV